MTILRALWKQLWLTAVVALVLLALYTSLGRQLMPLVETYHAEAELWLTEALGQPVSLASLHGDWTGLSPVVKIQGLEIAGADGLKIASIEAELVVSASIFYRMPVFRRVVILGLQTDIQQLSASQWQLAPSWTLELPTPPAPSVSPVPSPSSQQPRWIDWLALQQQVTVLDAQLSLQRLHQPQDHLTVRRFDWRSRGSRHELNTDVAVGQQHMADIRLSASLEGALWPWSNQHGRIFIEADEQDWAAWLTPKLESWLQIKQLRGAVKGWLTLEDGRLQKLYLDTHLAQLQVLREGQEFSLGHGQVLIAGEHSGNDWHLRLKPTYTDTLPFESLGLSQVQIDQQPAWQLSAEHLDVAKVRLFLEKYQLLPEKLALYIDGTALVGRANDVRVAVFQAADKTVKFDLRAQLQSISSQAFHGIPALADVDAQLHLQPHAGVVAWQDDALSVHLSDLYDPIWHLTNASGQFRWLVFNDHAELLLENTTAKLQDNTGTGHWPLNASMKITLPRQHNEIEPNLGLLLGLAQGPVGLHQQLVPNMVGTGLQHWLSAALQQGQAQNVAFALQTSLGLEHPLNSISTQLALRVDDAKINYLDGWPKVEQLAASLYFDNPNLDIALHHGRTLGGQLEPSFSHVKLRHPRQHPELEVATRVVGDSAEALRYLTTTPLADVVKHGFDQWQLQGHHRTDLLLRLTLGQSQTPPNIWLNSKLQQNQLLLPPLALPIRKIDGQLSYDSRQGLSAKNLTAEVLGGALVAQIDSKVASSGALSVALTGQGKARWPQIHAWQPLQILAPLSGDLSYKLKLQNAAGTTNIQLTSDLVGTEIDLPPPLLKLPEQASPLTLALVVGETVELRANYNQQLQALLAFNAAGIERGQVLLGGLAAHLPSQSGVEIGGEITSAVDVQRWWQRWQQLNSVPNSVVNSAAATASPNPVQRIDLNFTAVDAWGVELEETHVQAQRGDDYWQLQLSSPVVKGQARLFDLPAPLQLTLDYLYLPVAEPALLSNNPALPVVAVDALANVEPDTLPAFTLTLKEFFMGGRNFGRWQLTSRPVDQGMAVHINTAELYGMQIKGDMRWLLEQGQHHTYLDKVELSSTDVGKIQRGFRLVPLVEGKKLQSVVTLQWPASPAGIDLAELQGRIELNIRDGSLATDSGGAGNAALKAVGALNLSSLSRRLKLDFSDLYQSGVAFDKLQAHLNFDRGVMNFIEPMRIDGPGGKFQITGSTQLLEHTLDMEVAVTLPITSNLPMVAILAGLAPPVAASIFVTEKLVGAELSRFTTAKYDLTGTWADPEMTLRGAFAKTEKPSLKQRFLGIFGR